ncbi:hypothetical protein BCR34DRAFT_562285 [Clohesyomyces aquaticus]|uniref:Uncharacterized protein n=1 Tax=Clohesyomyces aquaticus TaxID=1231657 RepID=A0A1Y1ZSL2_9PLEO|nr:hypothetical protein BCR34DRAFT_562285 [Clohesyomyces aquaticus]
MNNGEEGSHELLLSRSLGQEMSGLGLGDLDLGVGNETEDKSKSNGSDYSNENAEYGEKAEEKAPEDGNAQKARDQNNWSDGLKRVLSVFKKTPPKQNLSPTPDQHYPPSPSEKEAAPPPTTPTKSKTSHSPHDIYKDLLGNTDPSPSLPPRSALRLQSHQSPSGNSPSSSSPSAPSPTPLPAGLFYTKMPWRPSAAPTTNPNPIPSPYTYTSTTTTIAMTTHHSPSTHLYNTHPSLLSSPPGFPQTPGFPPPSHENQSPNTHPGLGPEVAIWSTLASSLPSPLPFDPLSPTSSILRQNALNRMAQLDHQAAQAVRRRLAREKYEREKMERGQGGVNGGATDANLGPAHVMSPSPSQSLSPANRVDFQGPHSPVEIARASTVSYQRIGGQSLPRGNGNGTSASPAPSQSQDRSRSRSRDRDQEMAGMPRGADEIEAGHSSSSSSSSSSAPSTSSSAKHRSEMRRRLRKQKRHSSRQTGGTLTQRESRDSHVNEHGRSADFLTDPFTDMLGKDSDEDDGKEDDMGSVKSKSSAKLRNARPQPE